MRFDPRYGETAADLVNRLPAEELADILGHYGEERQAWSIAKAIVAQRPLTTTGELATLLEQVVGHGGRIHPATRTFQALRIAVNGELKALEKALPHTLKLLAPGGCLALISFHSLEDRLVKRFMRRESQDCICPPDIPVCVCDYKASLQIVTDKPIRPSEEEVKRNPRSRIAKLRIASRL